MPFLVSVPIWDLLHPLTLVKLPVVVALDPGVEQLPTQSRPSLCHPSVKQRASTLVDLLLTMRWTAPRRLPSRLACRLTSRPIRHRATLVVRMAPLIPTWVSPRKELMQTCPLLVSTFLGPWVLKEDQEEAHLHLLDEVDSMM